MVICGKKSLCKNYKEQYELLKDENYYVYCKDGLSKLSEDMPKDIQLLSPIHFELFPDNFWNDGNYEEKIYKFNKNNHEFTDHKNADIYLTFIKKTHIKNFLLTIIPTLERI